MAVGSAAVRLEELLEQIRMAFDSVSQDVEHSKSQHNDYERRGNQPPSPGEPGIFFPPGPKRC
jgi:Tup N-terminal